MSTRWFADNKGISVFESEFLVSRALRALGPERTFIVAMVAYVLVPWLWALRDGTVGVTSTMRGLTSPENNYIYVLPFLFGAVAYYLRDSMFLVPRLIARGVLSASPTAESAGPTEVATERAVDRIVTGISSSRLSRFARPAVVVVWVLLPALFLTNGAPPESRPWLLRTMLGSAPHSDGWLFSRGAIRPVAFFFSLAFHGTGMAILTAWAITHLRAARLLGRLLADDNGLNVDLKILHPDTCMGLQPISDLVRHSAIVLLLVSLTLFTWSAGFLLNTGMGILADSGFRAAWVFYLVFAPVLFFAPLASARRRMWILKEETLARLGGQIQSADTTSVASLSDTYRLTLGASVWPFTWATLTSFFASLGVPLLITAMSELIGRLFKGS